MSMRIYATRAGSIDDLRMRVCLHRQPDANGGHDEKTKPRRRHEKREQGNDRAEPDPREEPRQSGPAIEPQLPPFHIEEIMTIRVGRLASHPEIAERRIEWRQKRGRNTSRHSG